MNTIICIHCGRENELTTALTKDIEKKLLKSIQDKHSQELEAIAKQSEQKISSAIEEQKQLIQAELTKKMELKNTQLAEDIKNRSEENQELRDQLKQIMEQLRDERKSKQNLELEMQKKLLEEENKIREEATKESDEKNRLNIAAKEKTIADLQKALTEAQRKANQGSQQLQGEILELDLEKSLAEEFRDDNIQPIAKGVKGGDIRQVVCSPRGVKCGVILWEIKRTKSWKDEWVNKLKEDLRNEKANIPVIITEVMPKSIKLDIGNHNGVWVCKPHVAIVLSSLLRKGLLDVGLQRAISNNRETKAEALYNYVASHEFAHQVESMLEVYKTMKDQIENERKYFTRFWAERETQINRLAFGTTSVVGSMSGYLGPGTMPKIKGLDMPDVDLLEDIT